MTRTYEEETYVRGRSERRRGDSPPRGYSPDYSSGGHGPRINEPGPYAAGAIPAYSSQPRLLYDADRPLSPRDSTAWGLQVPSSGALHRPRSMPPPTNNSVARRRDHSRPRSRSRSRSSSRSSSGRSRERGPVGKARHALEHTFSPSTSGLGVGLLGAVVGGLVAREATQAAGRHRDKGGEGGAHGPHNHASRAERTKEQERSRMISTVVGAVVGGLGANAIEKRFEVSRKKDKEKQDTWEKKWGRESDLPSRYDSRDEADRPRSRHRRDDDRYDDEDDYVYDDRRDRRRRSEEAHRYRN